MAANPQVNRAPIGSSLLALVCAAGYVGFALSAKRVFFHITGLPGSLNHDLAVELGWSLLLLAAVLLALRAPTGGSRSCSVLSSLALILVAPFVADPLCWLLTGCTASGRSSGWLFLVLTTMLACLPLVRLVRSAASNPSAGAPDRCAAPPRQSTRPGRWWLRRAALCCSSVVVSLLLCELLFRGFGPEDLKKPVLVLPGGETLSLSEIALLRPTEGDLGEQALSDRFRPYLFIKGGYDRPEWDYFDEQGCVDYVFNRYGLRDEDFELEKQPDEYRVVAIGDSFTFGVGVQLEDCWPQVLESLLRADFDRPVEVINAGFASGHRPPMYQPWIAEKGLSLKPDLLIVGLCLNDMHSRVDLYAYRKRWPDRWLGGHSRLLPFLQTLWLRRTGLADTPIDFATILQNDPAQWQRTQQALAEIRDDLDRAGVRFLVAIMPMLSGLTTRYPYEPLTKMVRSFCRAEGIDCIDLAPPLFGIPDRELWVHPTDQHPNDRGQRLIAEEIFRHVTGKH